MHSNSNIDSTLNYDYSKLPTPLYTEGVIDESDPAIQNELQEDSAASQTYTLSQLEDCLRILQDRQQINDAHTKRMVDELELREQYIKARAKLPIVFSDPLLSREGVSIIQPNTINVIQGKYAQHKSRLAEMLVSCLLAMKKSTADFAGFVKLVDELVVCYLDTERNEKEYLPYAIQRMKQWAGYLITDDVPNFQCTTLKSIGRKERLRAIEAYIAKVRQTTQKHLFVVMDVVTDCLASFNDLSESMRLIDLLNNLCENHNATFLVLIHENPSNEKARGHIGTEIANKASTVMRIGIENEGKGTNHELIKLEFLKLRADKIPDDIYFQLDSATKQLILAEQTLLASCKSHKPQSKANEIADSIGLFLAEGEKQYKEVIQHLKSEFGICSTTIQTTVNEIIDDSLPIYHADGEEVRLTRRREGNKHYLFLETLA